MAQVTRRRWFVVVGAGFVAAMCRRAPTAAALAYRWRHPDGSRATVVTDLQDGSIGRDMLAWMPRHGYALVSVTRP